MGLIQRKTILPKLGFNGADDQTESSIWQPFFAIATIIFCSITVETIIFRFGGHHRLTQFVPLLLMDAICAFSAFWMPHAKWVFPPRMGITRESLRKWTILRRKDAFWFWWIGISYLASVTIFFIIGYFSISPKYSVMFLEGLLSKAITTNVLLLGSFSWLGYELFSSTDEVRQEIENSNHDFRK